MRFRRLLVLTVAATFIAGLFAFAAVSSAPAAQAQLAPGLTEIGGTVKLPSTDPRVIAARIINVALGLVGIILVVIIIYAGFLYMTSGGDAEKTQTALKYIRNAVIGLIIVLSSWAIARFVIDRLISATGGGGGGVTGTGPGGGAGFGGAGGAEAFKIISITPQGSVATKKVIVKIVFTKPVESPVPANAVTVERLDGTQVAGTASANPDNNKELRFVPNQPCPAPNGTLRCYDDNTDYRVKVSQSLKSLSGAKIACGGFAPACENTFKSGTTVDVTPPNASITYPISGQSVSADALVDVAAYVTDETGIAYASFRDGTNAIGDSAPQGSSPTAFDAHVQWDTAGLQPQSQHALTAIAYDVDSGVKTSDPVSVVIRPAHCFNGSQDQGETGMDCGGDVNSPEYCGACFGSSCSSNTQCASGVCSNGACVEQPTITSVTPNDGAAGTYVTLKGVNFGANGKVTFLGSTGSAGVEAKAPQACVDYGAKTWSPTEVIVEVPSGAQSGPIRVTNNTSGLSDDTNAPPNPFINDFIVNNTLRPGICAAVPNVGTVGNLFKLIGVRFGTTAAGVAFGEKVISTTSWTDGEIQALIPNVSADKTYPVTVTVSNQASNPVGVQVISKAGGGSPELTDISPASGPIGTYVNISGKNFTDSVGSVMFKEIATGKEALADTNFPPACSLAFWSDTSIVIKVPSVFTKGGTGAVEVGAYTVRVVTPTPGAPASNEVNFALNTDPATPGICGITPSVAPVGTAVQIYGERFTSGPGKVTFYQNKNGTATPWADTQISSVIPTGAITGPVKLTPASNGLVSNGYKIEVRNCNEAPNICKSGEECCGNGACAQVGQCTAGALTAMFAWRTSTGLIPRAPRVVEDCKPGDKNVIPSPSPWDGRAGGDQACVNAPVVMRFTTRLEPSTVKFPAKNFRVFECTAGGNAPCSKTTELKLASGYPDLKTANPTQDYVTLYAEGGFKPSATYQTVLTTGIKGFGPEGGFMEENAAKCGAGNSYCFTFRTRDDTTPCQVGSVLVSPDPFYAHDQGEKAAYAALPIAKEDACIALLCKSYAWKWGTSGNCPSCASVTHNPDLSQNPPMVEACEQTVTAELETGNDPVKIDAETAGVKGSGDFYINFIPPRVESYGPNCDQACVNAAAWGVFNVELDEKSVTASNVEIKECTNENCLEFLSPLSLEGHVKLETPYGTSDPRKRQITIEAVSNAQPPSPLLKPGRYYKVTLKGGTTSGIKSKSGVPMTGLNDPQGFSWSFRTKLGDQAFCEVDKILMAPTEKYETTVSAKQGFTAAPFSSPDVCSEKGQQLAALGGFVWGSSNQKVAVLYGSGNVDTGAELPPGCNGICLWTGAAGKAGKTAQCGNGLVETTNVKYCLNPDSAGMGKTPWNQKCQLLPPDGKGGEECDDANDNDADACSNTCLWNPIANTDQGGTCGNATLNSGEDCDFGKQCNGAAATSTTPNGSDCTSPAKSTECLANGGACAVPLYRGCSTTCRKLGSPAGNSTCGNGDIADGEDCDDGNLAGGDGCSAICLNEGSSKGTYALCGNEKLEPGEACEKQQNQSWPAPGCDPATCLNTGVAPCNASGQTSCCGNGNAAEPGKDCDDWNAANADGCNSLCLFEGSSDKYSKPSFCSNSVKETGEQCEAPPGKPPEKGDGKVDPFQIASIVGDDEPDKDTGKMASNITAALSGKTGTAIYGLQCGFTDERMCSADKQSYSVLSGLTTSGCCSERPKLDTHYPPNGSGESLVKGSLQPGDVFPTGVCRNVLISGAFNSEMDESSLSNNLLVAKKVLADSCPSGLKDVTDAIEQAPKGWKGFVLRFWSKIVLWFGGRPAYAQKWCAGTVTGSLQFHTGEKVINSASLKYTTFDFTLDTALEPATEYRVRFLGDASTSTEPLSDNDVPGNRWGIKTKRGTVARQDAGDSGPLTWHFMTGNKICVINNLKVTDLSLEHPYFYNKSNESHPFTATARSIQNGIPVPLSPVKTYKWEWQNWAFSNSALIEIKPPALTPPTNLSTTSKEVASKNVSGAGYLSARLRITDDEVNVPSSEDLVIQGTANLTINVCENPWPSISSAPFRDTDDSPELKGTSFEKGPFFNFSVTYCRDAGDPGPDGDLPGMLINPVAPNPVDTTQGIARQYLLTFREDNLKKDAIGIRITTNPFHFSPLEWYRSKGFKGNPKPIKVDGYEAIEDGRTVYVSAANTDGPDASGQSSDIYSNIYLISYNEGAEPVTRQIKDALLASFSFNVNVQYGVANACEDANGNLESGTDGLPVVCSADWECDKLGSAKRCASFKGKAQRDLVRLSDFQIISRLLKSSKDANKKYPRLASGSYLPGITTSLWPSWAQTLGAELGSPPPADPVNRFVTCGRCSQSKTACVQDADCPAAGEVCAAEGGFDPLTCWNDQKKEYKCPFDSAEGPKSRLYQYRALQSGDRFELASDFEIPPPDPSDLGKNWWQPKPLEEAKECDTPETKGNFCATDADCRLCPGGVCGPIIPNSCVTGGGSFKYVNVCTGSTAGITGTCGDGVVDIDPAHTSCLGGAQNGKQCATNANCPAGICAPNEICELSGPTAKQYAACTASGKPGKKVQTCLLCRGYADDPKQPGCFALKECGNGKIDGVCSNDPTKACAGPAECAPGGTCSKEVCDDGKSNGTTGSCKADCSGYGAYCGDGQISPGEACDNGQGGALGASNGDYCKTQSQGGSCEVGNSCNLTCNGPSAFCGDSIVSAPEVCDGNTQSTVKALCKGGSKAQEPCDTDADCPGGACGGIGGTPACSTTGKACAGPDGICSNKSQSNAQPADYCLKDADCGGGNTCIPTAGRSCVSDDFCGSSSKCLGPVPSVRTRPCAQPGTTGACTYTAWSTCHPAVWCGNGQADAGEACDDGNLENTDGCTNFCAKNACGDGALFKGVEECDNGIQNGKPCTNAEYGSTCSACSTSCKLQLTQGGYCGDGVRNPGSPEQCDKDDLGPNKASLTCKGLGYDYAKEYKTFTVTGAPVNGCLILPGVSLDNGSYKMPPNAQGIYDLAQALTNAEPYSACYGAKITFSDEVVACNSTCTFGGCAYCGSETGSGIVEGLLKDSLYQQPVPNARVTLFYKGLQVAQTTSDGSGYFALQELDTHAGCNQYKLVVDMYKDNLLTENFDESKRGGYLPVKVGPFESNNPSLINVVKASKQGQAKNFTGTGKERKVAEINMLPKLGPNEYIVQFWWSPDKCDATKKNNAGYDANGCPADSIDKTIEAYKNAADKSKYLSGKVNDYHDLVIRTPFTFTPGTYGACSLASKPKAYGGNGDICFNHVGNDGAKPFTDACSGVDYGKSTGDNDERFNFVISGMAKCTNKVRATAARTCTIRKKGDKSGGKKTELGCSSSWDCENPAKYNINGELYASIKLASDEEVKCLGPADGGEAEKDRQGSSSVLQGSAGAYLFCFHPESPGSKVSDCRNFIVPPQSAFISGKGGQYDVIVSQYKMFAGGSAYGPQRAINWLYDHNAELRLYDKDGLYDVWNYRTVNPKKPDGTLTSVPGEWGGNVLCPNSDELGDSTTLATGGYGARIKGAVYYPSDAGWLPVQYKALYITFAGGVNQSWAPLSIDTTSKIVKPWGSGERLAAYRYFGDMYTFDDPGKLGSGNGICWFNTCKNIEGKDSKGQATKWPPEVAGAQTYLCNDGNGKYSSTPDDPACDAASKDICVKYYGVNTTRACAKTVNANVKCIKFCTDNTNKKKECGGSVKGSNGTVDAFCGGSVACGNASSDFYR